MGAMIAFDAVAFETLHLLADISQMSLRTLSRNVNRANVLKGGLSFSRRLVSAPVDFYRKALYMFLLVAVMIHCHFWPLRNMALYV